MRIGFTGTRKGMTPQQQVAFEEWFLKLNAAREDMLHEYAFHHGDCVGADKQAHTIVAKYALRTIQVHPPLDDRFRARCAAPVIHEPLTYADRNKAIVAMSEVLMAAPDHPEERPRSGTWMTVRFARMRGMPIILLMPDGTVTQDKSRLQLL